MSKHDRITAALVFFVCLEMLVIGCMPAIAVDCRNGALSPDNVLCQANAWLINRQR